eukprot:m.182108 g.182108  ORF g.182108 m.182108 type:complete len:76 (+) comp16639_c4_seq1:1730-1957(+)
MHTPCQLLLDVLSIDTADVNALQSTASAPSSMSSPAATDLMMAPASPPCAVHFGPFTLPSACQLLSVCVRLTPPQ